MDSVEVKAGGLISSLKILPLFRLLYVLLGGIVSLPVTAANAIDPEQVIELRQLVDSGRLGEADRQIKGLLTIEPGNPDLQFIQALIADKSGDTGKAMRYYRQLIHACPGMLEPYNNLALLQSNQGDYRAAIDTLEQAIQSDPKLATLYSNLTALFARLASESYKKALGSENPAPTPELASLDQTRTGPYSCTASRNAAGKNESQPTDQSRASDNNDGSTSSKLKPELTESLN